MNKKIDPKRFYNLTETLEFIPWIQSIFTLRKWIESDMKTNNYLGVIRRRTGTGTGVRYHIKGDNIINYLAIAEDEGLRYSRKEVNKMEDETNTEEVNKAVSEAQADERAEGVDEMETTEGTNVEEVSSENDSDESNE